MSSILFAHEFDFWQRLKEPYYFNLYHKESACSQQIEQFQKSLLDWDEYFISPCVLNEVSIGIEELPEGTWTPKIKFLGFLVTNN